MQRQDKGSVFGNDQIVRRDGDTLPTQAFHLLHQMPWIDNDAIADDRELPRAYDARRQQRELVDDATDDQRMAGIVATLKAHDDVGAFREPIDDLALALVAPLRADYRYIGHDIPREISCR